MADANEILEMAWKLNPDDYKLPMYIGYNYFLYSKNSEQVIKWMKIALRNPEAPRRLLWIVEEAEKGRFSGYSSLRHIICTQCEQAEDTTQKRVFCTRCGYTRSWCNWKNCASDTNWNRDTRSKTCGIL